MFRVFWEWWLGGEKLFAPPFLKMVKLEKQERSKNTAMTLIQTRVQDLVPNSASSPLEATPLPLAYSLTLVFDAGLLLLRRPPPRIVLGSITISYQHICQWLEWQLPVWDCGCLTCLSPNKCRMCSWIRSLCRGRRSKLAPVVFRFDGLCHGNNYI